MPSIKVLVAEIDGVEKAYAEERLLHAYDTAFDNTGSGLSSTDVNNAIKELGIYSFSEEAESLAESQNTSTTTWVTKVTLNTSTLLLGDYKLSWFFKWRFSAANRGMGVRIMDGGTTLIAFTEFISNVGAVPTLAGFKKLTGISGAKTYTLEFKIGVGTGTAYMSDAILQLEKI